MQALVIAGALAAAVAGGAMTSGVMWAYDTFIDDPAIVAAERASATSAADAAAARATRDEQLRQFRIGEAAFEQSYRRDLEDQTWQQARVNLLNMEIEAYEHERQADGSSCPLTRRDLDFLAGLQHHGAAP